MISSSYFGAGNGAGGTATPLPAGAVRADAAIAQIIDLYRTLQQQAVRIDRVYGAQVPCDVQAHHNAAVKAYQKAAQSVFDQILARDPNYKIVQQVYDASGTLMNTVTKPRPVIPAVYQVAGCPLDAPMAGTFGDSGFGVAALVWIAIAVVAGASVVTLAYVVISNWPLQAVETAKAQAIWVKTQLDCVEQIMSERKISLPMATTVCKDITGEAPKASSSWGLWALLLGVGGIGGYGFAKAWRRD